MHRKIQKGGRGLLRSPEKQNRNVVNRSKPIWTEQTHRSLPGKRQQTPHLKVLQEVPGEKRLAVRHTGQTTGSHRPPIPLQVLERVNPPVDGSTVLRNPTLLRSLTQRAVARCCLESEPIVQNRVTIRASEQKRVTSPGAWIQPATVPGWERALERQLWEVGEPDSDKLRCADSSRRLSQGGEQRKGSLVLIAWEQTSSVGSDSRVG